MTRKARSRKVCCRMKQGDNLALQELTATQRFERPAPRYTEASLVKKLEELGIGRPSTYAPTISTVQKRGYVEKESRDGTPRPYRILTLANGSITEQTASENTGAEKQKLFPTDIGMVVNDFLVEHFPVIVDLNFVRRRRIRPDRRRHHELARHDRGVLQALPRYHR